PSIMVDVPFNLFNFWNPSRMVDVPFKQFQKVPEWWMSHSSTFKQGNGTATFPPLQAGTATSPPSTFPALLQNGCPSSLPEFSLAPPTAYAPVSASRPDIANRYLYAVHRPECNRTGRPEL